MHVRVLSLAFGVLLTAVPLLLVIVPRFRRRERLPRWFERVRMVVPAALGVFLIVTSLVGRDYYRPAVGAILVLSVWANVLTRDRPQNGAPPPPSRHSD